MAKGKKKPASTPKVKKVEPILKDEAVEVKKVVLKKEDKPKKEKKKATKKVTKHTFPEKEECKHLHTKRTIDRRLRVMYVCTNPVCKKIVSFGGR